VAKKKSRVPPPPRPVQAPKSRPVQAPKVRQNEPRRPLSRPRTRLWLIGSGVAVVVLAVAVILATVIGGGSSDASALAAAGCVQQTFPAQGRNHVQELAKGFKYNSFPPTSGPHYPQPAVWNIYDQPVRQIYLVHNLEHGGIVVQYGDKVPQATVDQIKSWYVNGDRNAIVVAPLPALGDKVALTAWTHLATCPGFDAKAYDAFVGLHRYKAPEKVPASAMQPGN
jgi:hypothetical protein